MAAKTIIVTGASKGLGFAIAEYIVSQKHNLVALGRDKSQLEQLKSKYPKQVELVFGDFQDQALPQKAVATAKSSFGRLDGLVVNHAVLGVNGKIADCDLKTWRRDFETNFFSAVACIQSAIPDLRESKGCIVITSTGLATRGSPTMGLYGTSKAALINLGQALKAEEPDITTLSIAPGMVDTAMQKEIREKNKATMPQAGWEYFNNAYKNGELLPPNVPGTLMAKVVLDPPKELTGEYLRWNGEQLQKYHDKN